MKVKIRWWDRDIHDDHCDCGLCSSVNHVSIGFAVVPADNPDDPLDVFYAPDEEAAEYDAWLWCQVAGLGIIQEDEEDG